MFQFRAFPSYGYLIHRTIPEYCSGVLPHSEISGSKLICSSPKLIAACHVLHRLLMPRHSPCALISLTYTLRMIFLAKFSWIMQAQQKLFTKLYLPFIKSFPQCCFISAIFRLRPLLPCFHTFFLCSVFKVQLRIHHVPSKLNNARIQKPLLRLLIELGAALRASQ